MDVGMLFSYFKANGWSIKRRIQDADLVLVATCGYDNYNEEHSIRLLLLADKKRKRGSKLVVIGCLAGINEPLIQGGFEAETMPPVELERLDETIGAKVKLREVQDANNMDPYFRKSWRCFGYSERHGKAGRLKSAAMDIEARLQGALMYLGAGVEEAVLSAAQRTKQALKRGGRSSLEPVGRVATVRVAYGCDGECSYCAIPFAAGKLCSKPLEQVLSEFDGCLDKGYRKFRIIAGDIGPYGQDTGTNVVELFKGLFEREERFRLAVRSINPEWLIAYAEGLTELFKRNSERMYYITTAVQSGSERILKLMRRKYGAAEVKQCLCRLREECPGLRLRTHVMAGFPTETEEDFEDTVELLREVKFDEIVMFSYADRPKTKAREMGDKVAGETIKERISKLQREFPLTTSF
jgi:tRNA A37 methylthiotransferase MiaB